MVCHVAIRGLEWSDEGRDVFEFYFVGDDICRAGRLVSLIKAMVLLY